MLRAGRGWGWGLGQGLEWVLALGVPTASLAESDSVGISTSLGLGSLAGGVQPGGIFSCCHTQGWGSLEGCRLWGSTESYMTEVTQQHNNYEYPNVDKFQKSSLCSRI